MIKNRKFRKLLRNPKMFFRDYFAKRMPKYGLSFRLLKYNGKYNYVIISAVYNVEDYLDDYFASIIKQKMNFRKNITIVLVDDGSTDSSALIIKKWQSKYPSNIIYIYKENGGQASARNVGIDCIVNNDIKSDWISFIDPDDFIHVSYFCNIDKFLILNSNIKMVSANQIFFHEKNNIFSDTHPLRYRFASGDAILPSNDLCKHMQLSVSTALFLKNEVRRQGLRFDPRIYPHFEDGHFANRYLINLDQGSVAFLQDAKYFYRKRTKSNSTLDLSSKQRGNYIDVLKYGYISLLDECMKKYGFIPTYIQHMIVYDMSWLLRSIVSNKDSINFLSDADREISFSLMSDLFNRIDVDVIRGFELDSSPMSRLFYKSGAIRLFKPDSSFDTTVYIDEFDMKRSMILMKYYTHGLESSEEIRVNSELIEPCYTKTIQNNLFDHPFSIERRIWIPLPQCLGTQKLEVLVNGQEATLQLLRKVNTDSKVLYLFQIADAFMPTISKMKRMSPYSGSWLFIDRINQADDNAEHFYRYLQKHHPEQKSFFILARDSHDWGRLAEEGFNLIPYGEKVMGKALSEGAKLLSSHVHANMIADFKKGGTDKEFVFLQHGIIKHNLSNWLNKYQIDLFVTTSQKEYDSIAGNFNEYKFSSREVVLTGLPRHDSLIENENLQQDRILLVMPTWRKSVVGPITESGFRERNNNFINSCYAQKWQSFFNNKSLINFAIKNNFKIYFFPHPEIQVYKEEFCFNDIVRYIDYSDTSVQDMLKVASIMVTDYSSVAFDFAITGKPLLYYQFDQDDFFEEHWGKGYFDYERDGFGPILFDEDSLVSEIIQIATHGSSEIYKKRTNDFFAYRDGKNCHRLYLEIKRRSSAINANH